MELYPAPVLTSLWLCLCAQVEKVSAIDQTPRTVERDVLKEIFPTENLNTPTGIRYGGKRFLAFPLTGVLCIRVEH